MQRRYCFQHMIATITLMSLAVLLLAACAALQPAPAPTYAPSKMPPPLKWMNAFPGDINAQDAYQVKAAGVALTVHDVLLLGERKLTVFFSTYVEADDRTPPPGLAHRPQRALPEQARLGASGQQGGDDSSPTNEIVELAHLGRVTLLAATFELPRASLRQMNFDVSAMKTLAEGAPPGQLRAAWSIALLKTDHPEKPDGDTYLTYMFAPSVVSHSNAQIMRGDGQKYYGSRPGAWVNSAYDVVDQGDLSSYRLQAADVTDTIYIVRHNDGRVERVSLETYEKWIEPTQHGYWEAHHPSPTPPGGTPHPTMTPMPPEMERALQATREWLDRQPTQSIQDIIKQFPPAEQTPRPLLNPPTRVP